MNQLSINSTIAKPDKPDYCDGGQPQPILPAVLTTAPKPIPIALIKSYRKDPLTKRREQNRLAQRRHREKKKKEVEKQELKESEGSEGTSYLAGCNGTIPLASQSRDTMSLQKFYNANSGSYQTFPDEHIIFMPACGVKRALFEVSKSIAKIVPSFKFDPNDDRLISPVNSLVLSSMAENDYLPITDSMPGSTSSSSSSSASSADSKASRWTEALDLLPENLRPTRLQLSVPHNPHIDVFPWPSFRDKLLLMCQHFYAESSCEELVNGILVWGNRPELDDNWEITPRFAQQVWFLLDKDIIKRTNWWRSQRNLPPIDLDAIATAQSAARILQHKTPILLHTPSV